MPVRLRDLFQKLEDTNLSDEQTQVLRDIETAVGDNIIEMPVEDLPVELESYDDGYSYGKDKGYADGYKEGFNDGKEAAETKN